MLKRKLENARSGCTIEYCEKRLTRTPESDSEVSEMLTKINNRLVSAFTLGVRRRAGVVYGFRIAFHFEAPKDVEGFPVCTLGLFEPCDYFNPEEQPLAMITIDKVIYLLTQYGNLMRDSVGSERYKRTVNMLQMGLIYYRENRAMSFSLGRVNGAS